jgi:hypothetical protein
MESDWDAVQAMEDALLEDDEFSELDQYWHERCADAAAEFADQPKLRREREKPTSEARNWRELVQWEQIVSFLTPVEFRRYYRLTDYDLFCGVAERIDPHLSTRSKHASSLRGGCVPTKLKLAVTLRFLAGGSYLDIALCHGVSPNHVSKIVRQTVDALLLEYGTDDLVGLSVEKFGDAAFLERAEASFGRKNCGYVRGCVGAIDGCAIKINKPSLRDTPAPRHYYNRKGFFATVLQATCDGNRKFTWASLKGVGSTHDSTCYGISNLARCAI